MCSPGFAFLNVLLDPPHIWVVASEANDGGDVVLFMLSSLRSGADKTCIIDPDDYSALTKETVVVYGMAETRTIDWIRDKIENGFAKPKDAVPADVLERIQRGALASKHTARRIKRMITSSI